MEEKLEKILNSASKSDIFCKRLIFHIRCHQKAAGSLIKYGLNKLENGNYANTTLFNVIYKIFNASGLNEYEDRIKAVYSNLPSTWA